MDNDIEEFTENLNEIKFMENNINNLTIKNSSKKFETISSKKNSAYFENSLSDYEYMMGEINKLKTKLEKFENSFGKNEIWLKEYPLNNPLELRLGSSNQKNKKQEVYF